MTQPPLFITPVPLSLSARVRRICPIGPARAARPRRPRCPRAVFEPAPDAHDPVPLAAPAAAPLLTHTVLRLKRGVSDPDARAVLSEYARATCAEGGVLRCDVVEEGGGRWGVWIVFEGREGLTRHERSAHAAKVRLMVAGREGTDSGQTLGRLAEVFDGFWSVWPTAKNAWWAVSGMKVAGGEMVKGSAGEVTGERDALAALKERLNVLVESVGLGDAVVLVARARVTEDDYVVEVRELCVRICMKLSGAHVDGGGVAVSDTGGRLHNGIARAAVLESVGDARVITVVIAGEADAVHWDASVAAEMIETGAWEMQRGTSVFPDLAGWGIRGWADAVFNEPYQDEAERELRMRMSPEGLGGERKTAEEWFMEQEGIPSKEALEERLSEERKLYAERRAASGDLDLAKPLVEPGQVLEEELGNVGENEKSVDRAIPIPTAEVSNPVAAVPSSSDPPGLHLRVRHGSGAFGRLEAIMRGICDKGENDMMRILLVTGWNEARCQPLVMELDQGIDAGRVDLEVGVGVYGASASLASVAAGVSAARLHKADVIVGFGGGAVMDTAKAIASLLPLSPEDVGDVLSSLRGVAGAGRATASTLHDTSTPTAIPVVLVAGTVGSGAEVSEASILKAPLRRVSVCFGNAGKRVAIADPRLVLPRRISGRDVAMGGLQAMCFAVDVLLCPSAPNQATELAERAISVGRDAILQARREPVSSDGPSRDALVDCTTFAALAREGTGGLGVATCLSLALLDGARPTSTGLDAPLRTLLPRVMAAAVTEMDTVGLCDVASRAASIVLEKENATGADLSHYLLSLAEDIGVPMADVVGVHAIDMENAVQTVISGGLVSACADSRLLTRDALSHIVLQMTEQVFEL